MRLDVAELVPIVRIRTLRLGSGTPDGRGGFGAVRVRPIAIIERREGWERRHRINDPTTTTVRWMVVAAVGVLAVSLLMRRVR